MTPMAYADGEQSDLMLQGLAKFRTAFVNSRIAPDDQKDTWLKRQKEFRIQRISLFLGKYILA